MLVLTRKIGESIVIDDNIRITVLDVGHGRIRLGIEAPRDVPVHRAEVLLRDPDRFGDFEPHSNANSRSAGQSIPLAIVGSR